MACGGAWSVRTGGLGEAGSPEVTRRDLRALRRGSPFL